jgi:hypothetical protein
MVDSDVGLDELGDPPLVEFVELVDLAPRR